MIHRPLLAALALAVLPVLASAQVKPRNLDNLSDDFGVYVGAYMPMYKGHEADVVYGLTYGHFNPSGLGFRTGLQFIPRVAEVDQTFGLPVAFSYRTPARNTDGRVKSGAIAAGEAFGYEAIMGYRDPLRGALAAFIANLFSQAEFYAGITPGLVLGGNSPVETASWDPSFSNQQNSWTKKNGNFLMTLDAGACANYRIWRFDLKLSPAVHYNITKNYIYHTETAHREQGTDVVPVSVSDKPLRWFFSMTAGLSFRF